ncbi:hypothetical protein F4859DRAFT_526196 [Xylaria cf. heliscus]|nr:hypothetical protein F4859DRAFT_526196 [Xylaria cf. heliscus]
MAVSLLEQTRALVARLSSQCSSPDDFGSMSASIYDTAWLAMVQKSNGEETQWCFPQCFEYIMKHQLPSGGWVPYATPVDGILNTAAALLALRKHLRTCPENLEWLESSVKAEKALGEMLGSLDVETADQVGFEILVVQHIALLREEGVFLDSPNLDALRKVQQEKLAMLPPKSVHNAPSTLYHSLEALVGHIDFDQVSRWCEPNGSMMGSPSSTAAYLIYATSWDESAEAYLRNVLEKGSGQGNGSAPSAWPSSLFETSWAVATLLGADVAIANDDAETFKAYLQQALEIGQGTVGFAPGCLPDADDTAKAIITLCDLGYSPSIDGLLEAFETKDHFITYPNERNASFTTNCHVLISLLKITDCNFYISQIRKATVYVTSRAFVGDWRDKWNRSEYYAIMLLMKSYELLYGQPDLAREVFNSSPDLGDQIPILALDCLRRLLLQQETSGAWGGDTCEVTSYAVLSLASLLRLPWVQQVEVTSVVAAITRAKSFLVSHKDRWAHGHHLWVEKVYYAYDTLSEAYCLAASLVSEYPKPSQNAEPTDNPFILPQDILGQIKKAGNLIFRTPLMARVTKSVRSITEVQAGYYFSLLQRNPLSIFPRASNRKASYQIIIPLAFTACMAIDSHESLNPQLLQEMMVLSNLNFLVDEYMETAFDRDLADYKTARNLIENLFVKHSSSGEMRDSNASLLNIVTEKNRKPVPNGIKPPQQHSPAEATATLTRFIQYVLNHTAVRESPECYQDRLAFELRACILAHVTQAEDNHNYARQCSTASNGANKSAVTGNDIDPSFEFHNRVSPSQQYARPGRTFYNWVRSTSADHTSCPFSFIFFNALLYCATPHHRQSLFGRARTAYVAEDLCRHLSSLCRMYNDYGSLQRDAEERNLNSINFPEFAPLIRWRDGTAHGADDDNLSHAKAELLWVADYERRGVEMALDVLGQELQDDKQRHVVDGLRFFIDITDLFGQIYILKDVGLRNR